MRGRREHTVKELAKTGIKDMPRNAMWLLGKLIPDRSGDGADQAALDGGADRPESESEDRRWRGPTGRRHTAAESVDSLLRRADLAADRATAAEKEALDRAQEAKRMADEVRRIVDEADAQLMAAQIDAHKQMASQVIAAEAEGVEKIRRAEEEMAERIERIRSEGIEASQAELDKMRMRLGREADEARAKARRAADRAMEALTAADESVAQATELAAQAKRAAEKAASEAATTAQRLEWEERSMVEEAAGALADEGGSPSNGMVQEGRSATVSSSSAPTGAGDASAPTGDLDTLTHVELLAIAVTAEVPECGSMSRDELIEALSSFTSPGGDV